MTRRRWCLALAAALGVPALLGLGLVTRRRAELRRLAPPPELTPGTGTLIHGGLTRTYRLLVPPSCRADPRPRPLLLALHGGGGDGLNQQQVAAAGFNRLAQREGFLLAYPDGIERHWNDGRDEVRYRAHRERVDDVGFLAALVDRVAADHPVDPDRVYVTGISNGAMLSHRCGVELATRVAAIAPVAGSVPRALAAGALPGAPVSVVVVRGTADPLIPWVGGQARFLGRDLGDVLSGDEEARFWVARNGCGPEPSSEPLADLDPADGCRVRRDTWSGGRGGTEVTRYVVEEGGHTWPGGFQYFPQLLIGPTCRDLDGCEAIWAFFASHPRRR